ncbi:MAG: TolC family protein, partial [Planctomycetes bacterium]|nr:TolC family protein [Planctomycetota bacterium]
AAIPKTLGEAAGPTQPDFESIVMGIIPWPSTTMRALASDDEALRTRLAGPMEPQEAEQILWLRLPSLEARRERIRAMYARYDENRYLEDLVSGFRPITKSSGVMGSAAGSRRSQAAIAPQPGMAALRDELVQRSIEREMEALRAEYVERLRVWRESVIRLRFLEIELELGREHTSLLDDLESVLQANVSAGKSHQSELWELMSAREELRTTLFTDREDLAHLQQSLALALHAEGVTPKIVWTQRGVAADAVPTPDALRARLLERSPPLRSKRSERSQARARLALLERMTAIPLGWRPAAFESGLAPQAGAWRRNPDGAAPPDTSARQSATAAREALLTEARRRVASLDDEVKAATIEAETQLSLHVRTTRAALERVHSHREQLAPLARQSYESLRGAYAAGRTPYVETIRSARRLIAVEQGLARAERDFGLHRVRLLALVAGEIEP